MNYSEVLERLLMHRDKLNQAISAMSYLVGKETHDGVSGASTASTQKKRRKFSAETRKKMAEAQRKRYAALRKEKGG